MNVIKIKTQLGTTLFVKKEFLILYPDWETKSDLQLNGGYNAYKYLHNEDGPAIIMPPNYTSSLKPHFSHTFAEGGYYLNGEKLKEKEYHNRLFNLKLNRVVNEN